jgi:hypothetical protein
VSKIPLPNSITTLFHLYPIHQAADHHIPDPNSTPCPPLCHHLSLACPHPYGTQPTHSLHPQTPAFPSRITSPTHPPLQYGLYQTQPFLKANTKPIQHIPTQYPTYKQPNHITSNNIPQVNRLGQDYKLLGPIKPIQLNTPHKTKPFLPSNTPQTTMITHLLNPLVKG